MRLLILLLLLPVCLTAQRAKEREVRFVWADSGLVMRSAGHAGAEKITTVPYGAEVRLTGKIGDELFVTLFDGPSNGVPAGKSWKVSGHYREVTYGTVVGFVHSSYLSRWSPAKFEQTVDGYYKWNEEPVDTLFYHLYSDDNPIQEEIYQYSDGVTISRDFTEKYSGGTIMVPRMKLQEGFHFAHKYFSLGIYSTAEPDLATYFLDSNGNNEVTFFKEQLTVTIMEVAGNVVISFISSC